MAFNKKVVVKQASSNVDWKAYNKHLAEAIDEATDNGENKNLVCIISALIDSGMQKPDDEFTEYKWEDDERQNKLLEADFGCYVEEDKFYIPNRATDSVIIAVDFPDVMVDYGKYFNDGESDIKPYRHLLAGQWMGIAGITTLAPKSDGYGTLTRITKLGKATGLVKGSKAPSDFALGDLLGKVFTMDLGYVWADNKKDKENPHLNINTGEPSSKHKSIPTPDYDLEPLGISMDGGNTDEELNQLSVSVIKRLELAEGWEESELRKELIKIGKVMGEGGSPPKEDKKEEEESPKKSTKKTTPKKVVEEEDEDDPFADDE